jgi:transcriptional regulator with XRE-family HTH domain
MPAQRPRGGALERGEIPEVVALGNALTTLFKDLGIPQSQYAVRIHLDPASVSRFLNGKRMPPKDFIARLITEVERHRGAPLQQGVTEKLEEMRLAALLAWEPERYEMEMLRGSLEETRRDVKRLRQHQEALHLLLDKKEELLAEASREIAQIRNDWVVSKSHSELVLAQVSEHRDELMEERAELLRQIRDLKQNLEDTGRLREDAERRCAELEDKLLAVEAELTENLGGGDQSGHSVPLHNLQGQLLGYWEDGESHSASKELTEAAWSRQIEELWTLAKWVRAEGRQAEGRRLIDDAIQLRPAQDIDALMQHVYTKADPEEFAKFFSRACTGVASSRSTNEVFDLHLRWTYDNIRPRPGYTTMRNGSQRNTLLHFWPTEKHDESDLLEMFRLALTCNIERNVAALLSGATNQTRGFYYMAVREAFNAGLTSLAERSLVSYFDSPQTHSTSAGQGSHVFVSALTKETRIAILEAAFDGGRNKTRSVSFVASIAELVPHDSEVLAEISEVAGRKGLAGFFATHPKLSRANKARRDEGIGAEQSLRSQLRQSHAAFKESRRPR